MKKGTMPSYRWPSGMMRRALALKRADPQNKSLGHLVSNAFENQTEFLDYLSLVPGEDYKQFIEACQENSRRPPNGGTHSGPITLDGIAAYFNIDLLALKLDLVRACHEHCLDVSRIISSIAHPKVVLRNIKEALKPKGMKDRELFFWRHGELPGKGGVNVNVTTTAISGAKAESTPLPEFEEAAVQGSKIVREDSTNE